MFRVGGEAQSGRLPALEDYEPAFWLARRILPGPDGGGRLFSEKAKRG